MRQIQLNLAIILIAALAAAGCARQATIIEATFTCPGVSPLELERDLTLPLEITIAGMPGLGDVWTTTEPGQVRLVMVFESGRQKNGIPELQNRLQFAEATPALVWPEPVFRTLPQMPVLADGPLKPFVFIHPNRALLEAADFPEAEFLKQVDALYDATLPADELEQKLMAAQLQLDGSDIPLTRFAKIERIELPVPLVRHNGNRFFQLQPIAGSGE